MFGKEGDTLSGGEGNLNSILGPGCKVKGTIDLKGTLRVDGDFEGDVKCPETLIIGKSGVVKANVTVKNAVIGGKLVGNIKCELEAAVLRGDIDPARESEYYIAWLEKTDTVHQLEKTWNDDCQLRTGESADLTDDVK